MDRIQLGHSLAPEATGAAQEFHAQVTQPNMALVLFFCSSHYDLELLAREMSRLFKGVPLVGCTTAGEIGPHGFRNHSLSGASFPASQFQVGVERIQGLRHFGATEADHAVQTLMHRLKTSKPNSNHENSFALMLIDGLSVREEAVARNLQNALGRLPLIGGSAGDGMELQQTHLYFKGRFQSDCAVLLVASTPLPFRLFKTQHFVPTDQRLVVTAADAERRVVKELDGWPATEAYARLVGVAVDQLDSTCFAAAPMVVMVDSTSYVRAIQQANPDGSLTFSCAIEEGVVLRLARGLDLVDNLKDTLDDLRDSVGAPQLVITCDCILRKFDMVRRGDVQRVEQIFQAHKVVGFNSYGEQYRGVHVNQTLTGIAIGEGPLNG